MNKERIEKAGKLITYGLNALVNENDEPNSTLDDLQLDEVAEPGTFVRVQQFEADYYEWQQELVNEYMESYGEDDRLICYQIFRHSDALLHHEHLDAARPSGERPLTRSMQNYQDMKDFVLSRKVIRSNLVSGAMEWADAGGGNFVRIDNRQLDTMWTYLCDAGIPVDRVALERFCFADRHPNYDPLVTFINKLPQWDGHDHVGDLIRRITSDSHCIEGMRLWLRAITAKMMHYRDDSPWANMLMPILVGSQGLKKTTFARRILPVEGFFAQNIDFSPKGDWMRKMTNYLLVCDDEFDKHSDSQLATIKEALSNSVLMMRDPYAKRETPHVRLAAMIGTSNRLDLLRDETGTRRFLVINVEHSIDLDTPIPYEQIYAQLRTELLDGAPYFPQKSFEEANEFHNQDYRVSSMVEETFNQHFRFAPAGTPGAQWMTTSAIYEALCALHPMLKREKRTYHAFGRSLKPLVQRFALNNRLPITQLYTRRDPGSCYSILTLE